MKTAIPKIPQSCDSDLWQWAQRKQEQRVAERVSHVGKRISRVTPFSRIVMERIREILH